MEIDAWEVQIERERRGKDGFFARHWQSPIPLEDRAEFEGLDYYPPAPDHKFEIELIEHEKKSRVRMAYTRGEETEFIRWGDTAIQVL